MPGRSPSLLARLPLVLVPAAIVAAVHTAAAAAKPGSAPSSASSPAEGPKSARARVEAIELEASAQGGIVRTAPEYLDGASGAFAFGPTACGEPMGDRLLQQLFGAMKDRAPLEVIGGPAKRGELPCLQRVVFHAP